MDYNKDMHKDGKDCLPGVQCDVTNCHYNTLEHTCSANHIKVGPQYAASSADTICATFKPD